jgi:hypothetical protein
VGARAVGAVEDGSRAAGRNCLLVAFLWTGGVGASMSGPGMVVGAEGADIAFRLAGWSRVPVLPAFLALHEPVGGVGPFNVADLREEVDAVPYPVDVSRGNSYNNGSGLFGSPFEGVWLKKSGSEDSHICRVADGRE